MLRRSFSMSAAVHNLVKPSIPVHGLEGRYAAALYSAAYKHKALDAVEKDLKLVGEHFKSDKRFRDFILNPAVSHVSKRNAVKSIAEKLSLNAATKNVLDLLADNRRFNKLQGLIDSYMNIMRAQRDELAIEVTTAEPLSKSQETALSEALKKFAKSGQSLNIVKTVNPDIIGGMVVTIGDQYVDMSIANKVKMYEEVMKAAM